MEDKKTLNEEELNNVTGGASSGYCIKDYNNYEVSRDFCAGCGMGVRLNLPTIGGKYCYKCGNGVPGTWSI